jgi:MYXO-CTERM domain-containing protein
MQLVIELVMKKILSASLLAAALFTSNAFAASASLDGVRIGANASASFELPSATITSPQAGATVASAFIVSATVTGSGIAQVEVLVDNVSKGIKTSAPFDFSITGIADGAHDVTLSATGPGVQLQSSVNIFVGTAGNPPSDPGTGTGGGGLGDLPSASFSSPQAGDMVGSNFAVTAEVSAGITQLELLVDGKSQGVKTAAPFQFELTGIAEGDHSLSLIGTGEGISAASSINVFVSGSLASGAGNGDDLNGGCSAGGVGTSGGAGSLFLMAAALLRRRRNA